MSNNNKRIQSSNQPQSQLQQKQQKTTQESSEFKNEDNANYLDNFEAAIEQLRKIVENPSASARMSESQSAQQLQVLIEKYQKIEQMVLLEQEQINELVSTHLGLQQELSNEYVAHKQTIIEGKHDILQLSLVNKQALQYQNQGQKTLQGKQQEVEGIVKDIQKLQSQLGNNNQILQEKRALEKTIDQQNLRFSTTIQEFQKDQGEQKDGLDDYKVQIQNGEKETKLIKKEQIDMQRKIEQLRKTAIEIKSKTASYENQREVAASELKNEKRTLGVNERKLEEISLGLQSIETEIQKSNEHLQQIREVNENMKRKAHLIQSSMLVTQVDGQEVEELHALEALLEQYNNLIADQHKIIETKEGEKVQLEGHLTQLNLFAQQYIQKQSAQQEQLSQQQNQQVNQPQAYSISQGQAPNGDRDQENAQNVGLRGALNQKYNMECIQSQYEQEQDSLISSNPIHFNAKSQQQSMQSAGSAQANYQIFLEPKPFSEVNQQRQLKENNLNTAEVEHNQQEDYDNDREEEQVENENENDNQMQIHRDNDNNAEVEMNNFEENSEQQFIISQEEMSNEGVAQQLYHQYDPTDQFGNQQIQQQLNAEEINEGDDDENVSQDQQSM